MTTTTRFAARSIAAVLAAAATAGLAGTAAFAAPVAPVAPAAPAAAVTAPTAPAAGAEQAPQFWASGVNLTFVNKTDLTLTYDYGYNETPKTVHPGGTAYLPATSDSSNGISLRTADKRVYVSTGAHNHGFGTPNSYATVMVDGQETSRKEHQGENEHDTLVSLGGLTVHSYRGEDNKGKNFTLTLDKAGAAQATADNTTSTRNTYVYTNGTMVPVAKGTKAAVGQLERGKDSVIQFSRGGVPADIRVTWANHQAHFAGQGTHVSLANGESANFGYVTVTRADSASTTAYTYTFR